MKFNSLARFAVSFLFVYSIFLLYTSDSASLLLWIVFFQLKFVSMFADQVLHFREDQKILFSLFLGTPLTAMYWSAIIGVRAVIPDKRHK